MENEKQTENDSALEQSPKEALAVVSDNANQILDNPSLFNSRDYSFKSDLSVDGSQINKLTSFRNGAALTREFDAGTGNVMYSLGVLYHGGKDRGSLNYTWSSDGESILSAVNSEMNGVSDKPEMTSSDEIEFIQAELEKYFPTQQAEEIPVNEKKSFGSKLLVFLNK